MDIPLPGEFPDIPLPNSIPLPPENVPLPQEAPLPQSAPLPPPGPPLVAPPPSFPPPMDDVDVLFQPPKPKEKDSVDVYSPFSPSMVSFNSCCQQCFKIFHI